MFNQPQELTQWRVSNDTVMGGISQSSVSHSGNDLLFQGKLRLDFNGGFTSVWRAPEQGLFNGVEQLSLTVLGDGRTYQFRVRTIKEPRISYYANFQTNANETTTHTFKATDFSPVWRGRSVTNAPRLTMDDVTQVGVLLADKNPGTFSLVIKAIQPLNAT